MDNTQKTNDSKEKANSTTDCNYKEFAEEVDMKIKDCEITDKELDFSISITSLHAAQMKYPKLKYPTEAKKGCLGIVKHDPEFGFVFFVAKYGGLVLK